MTKRSVIFLLALGVCVALLSGRVVQAQGQDAKPAVFDRLLDKVKTMHDEDNKVNRQREQEFIQQRNRQQALLEEQRQKYQRLEDTVESLEKEFDDNEVKLAGLESIYEQRAGNFAELKGVMGQFVAALHNQLSDSMLSLHLSRWRDNMPAAEAHDGLPEVGEIESLLAVFLEYIAVQAESLRFNAEVLDTGGESRLREVVTIGPFTAISEGGFLAYLPEQGQFAELKRQPSARYLSLAQKYEQATEGFHAAPLDPSRGSLLSLLSYAPTLEERVRQGG